MKEITKLKKYQMWYKVKELYSQGLNKSQIGRELGLHRQTVSKYVEMSEEEFLSSESYDRHYSHKLDGYTDYVLGELRRWPFLSAAQVHDRLREHFPEFEGVTERTVFNFVRRLRLEHGIPKSGEKSCRPYERQAESPYGEYGQADFGERWMPVAGGGQKKVYFFAMCLNRSRYKYVYFSERPFTTATAVYAHELAFEYYGGMPKKIVYDQDRVLLNDEHLGDLVLTRGFQSLVRENGFTPVFCRKADPESKGLIENVVKYVKNNFLRGREFTDIESLNRQGKDWLERTGNGTMHHGIWRIPAEEFAEERSHLLPYSGTPTPPVEQVKAYHVRKDNVITYHGNYYTVPTGTYQGRDTTVYVSEKDGRLDIFSAESGKVIATHDVCPDKGRTVRDKEHLRDRESSLDEYQSQTRALLPADGIIDLYLDALRKDKPRNCRENLKAIRQGAPRYSQPTLTEAFGLCLKHGVLNGHDLLQVAESLRMRKGESLAETEPDYTVNERPYVDGMTPEKTDINTFKKLFQ